MNETIIIGGGVVGCAIAYGLLKKGEAVTIIDAGPANFSASKGNYGLVWCQLKGFKIPEYARITALSCKTWTPFSEILYKDSGIDVDYENNGGLFFIFDEESHKTREERLKSIKDSTDGENEYRMLFGDELKKYAPYVGEEVYSASFCPLDGTCDPLKLLLALRSAVKKLGAKIISNCEINSISCEGEDIILSSKNASYTAKKLVLSAGLSNKELANQVGINAPIKAIKGQILVSERLPQQRGLPSAQVRQTSEGTIICGASHEDVGLTTETTIPVMKDIATKAIKIMPALKQVNVNRAWGALRIYTPDTMPVYEQSPLNSNIFNVSCHSGVTLAAYHALHFSDYIISGQLPASLDVFKGDRF